MANIQYLEIAGKKWVALSGARKAIFPGQKESGLLLMNLNIMKNFSF